MRACTSASPSRAASHQSRQEGLQHLLSASRLKVCAPCSCLLPLTLGMASTCQMRDLQPKLKNPTQQMGPWSNGEAETKLRALCTHPRPHPPRLTCCHGQPRSAGQTLAMSRSDSGKADPARRWVLPGGEGVRSMHRLLCAALMESGCLQEPLTPRQGESHNKRL